MRMGHGLGPLEVGTHEHQSMVSADRLIERHARSPAFANHLCDLANECPPPVKRTSRMLELAQADANRSDAPAEIVGEQLRSNRHRSRHPRRRLRFCGLRRAVEQGTKQRHSGQAVRKNVVEPDQHRNLAVAPPG